MKKRSQKYLRDALVVLFTAFVMDASFCQITVVSTAANSQNDEPARWTQEDVTLEQQYATARKELAAAYQIALSACNALTGQSRLDCIADAKSDYERELSLLGFRLNPSR